RRWSIPLPKETSNGYRPSGLARAAVPLQRQARLVRLLSCPPRHRGPDHRMRMNASPVSEQLAGLVAFGWSSVRSASFDDAKSRLTTYDRHVEGHDRLSQPFQRKRPDFFDRD